MENKIEKTKRLVLIHLKYFSNLLMNWQRSYDDGVTCIIFSRDRAMQLDALLQSIYRYSETEFPIIIQYSCSKSHHLSYQRLIKQNPRVRFVKESKFRDTLIQLLENITTKYMFYLVDDQIFIHQFAITALLGKMRPRTFASLRLGMNINNWGIKDVEYHPLYTVDGNFIRWKWKENTYDFRYQFSVDGTIYRTIDILRCSRSIPFRAPNSYEANMNSVCIFKRDNEGIAFKDQVVINLIINASRVEKGYEQCESGEYTADDMLKLYQEGQRLDIEKISVLKYKSAHHIISDINTIIS